MQKNTRDPELLELNAPSVPPKKPSLVENALLTLKVMIFAGLVFLLLWVLDAVRAR